MAGVTSSWKTTVSPMTMAPCLVGVNAAHEPRPAAGLKDMPSMVTGTSVRAQPRRTTPSGVVVALLPAAWAIFPSSSFPPRSPACDKIVAATKSTGTRTTPFFCIRLINLLTFLGLQDRQGHGADRALAQSAFQFHLPAVGNDNAAGDGQTQPRSPLIPAAGLVHAIKTVEDPLKMFRRNPDPGVRHADARLLGKGFHSYLDAATFRRVLDGVIDD